MYQILDHLFLGTYENIENVSSLLTRDVRYILTLDKRPLPSSYDNQFCCKHILLLDLESENLIDRLEEALDFIENVRTQNLTVLVHW